MMNQLFRFITVFNLSLFICFGANAESGNVDNLERTVQKLVAPPFLPEHEQIATGAPKVVQIRMVIEEKLIERAPGSIN